MSHISTSQGALVENTIALLRRIYNNVELRKKILFTALIFAIFRLFAHVPVPAVDVNQLRSIFANNQFLGVLDIFSGGTLANFSIMAIGINPYITASIIFQLGSMVFPALKALTKEGEAGREKINQYTRFLSVPLAVVQSVSVLALLNSQGLLQSTDPLTLVAMISTLVAGALMLMWLGELVTLYGIGNGISMVLFAGIVSRFPLAVVQALSVTTADQYFQLAIFGLLFLFVIASMVIINEAVRKVIVQYAKRVRGSRMYGGQTTHLPLKVNQAGVLPIIFSVTIMLVPPFVGRLLAQTNVAQLVSLGQQLQVWFSPTNIVYNVVYFLIVFAFTFFSTMIFFNTEDLSEELKKSGAFVPGIRPGKPTQRHLNFIITRITFIGAVFLGVVAVLPSLMQSWTGIGSLALGGTSMLIVVSVVLETAKQVESQLVGQNYEKYI